MLTSEDGEVAVVEFVGPASSSSPRQHQQSEAEGDLSRSKSPPIPPVDSPKCSLIDFSGWGMNEGPPPTN